MKTFSRLLMSIGLILIVASFAGSAFRKIYTENYLIAAIAEAVIVLSIWGVIFTAAGLFIRKNKTVKSFFFFKLFFGAIMVGGLYIAVNHLTVSDAIGDIKAVMDDELYIAEGVVIESEITKREINKDDKEKQTREKYRYTQKITLDNEAQDTYSKTLGDKPDPIFEEGARYRIIALPYKQTILEYEIINE